MPDIGQDPLRYQEWVEDVESIASNGVLASNFDPEKGEVSRDDRPAPYAAVALCWFASAH